MAVQDEAKLEDLVAELHRLKSLLDEGDEEDRLDDLRSRYAELKQQNDELEACFEEALSEAKKLQEENIRLREEHQQALLQAQLQQAASAEEKHRMIDAHEREVLEAKLVEQALSIEELTNSLRSVESAHDELVAKVQAQRKVAQEAQRDAERERRRAAQLEEDAGKLGSLRAEVRRLRALEDVAGEVETLRKENEALKKEASRPASTDVHGTPPLAAGATAAYNAGKTAAAAEAVHAALQSADNAIVEPVMALVALVAGAEAAAATAEQERDRARSELKELHDTVFSKAFKAPSAWAEREVKYKMDKKQWDTEAEMYRAQLAALAAENDAFRAAAKSDEYESRIAALQAEVQQLQADKAAALHEVHELKLAAVPVSGEFVSNKPLTAGKPRDVMAELEASSTPTAAADSKTATLAKSTSSNTPTAAAGSKAATLAKSSSSGAPTTSSANKVAETVQRLHDMGLDDGQVPAALQYYAAAAAAAAPPSSTGTGTASVAAPAAEVVNHPRFQEVLALLQQAGVGPEDVAVYLARQQQLAPPPVVHEPRRPPTVGAHAVRDADEEEDDGTAASAAPAQQQRDPLRAAMAHFADAGMPSALVVAALRTTPDGSVALAAAPALEEDAPHLPADTPEARGAAALQFAAVLSHLEEHGIAPGDLAAMLVADQQHKVVGPRHPDASFRDVLTEVVTPAGGLAALLEHFASLGVVPAQLHLAMGAVLYTATGRRTKPADAWAQPSVQCIITALQDADVEAIRVHVLREVGRGTDVQQVAASAMQAADGDASAALAALRRHALHAAALPDCYRATLDVWKAHGVTPDEVRAHVAGAPATPALLACLSDCEGHVPEAAVPQVIALHAVLGGDEQDAPDVDVAGDSALQLLLAVGAVATSTGLSLDDALALHAVGPVLMADVPVSMEDAGVADDQRVAGQDTHGVKDKARLHIDGDPGAAIEPGTAVAINTDPRAAIEPVHALLGAEAVAALRDDPARVAELLQDPETSQGERQLLLLVQEVVDLQAQAGVLQEQVIKMQAALARTDDVSLHMEEAVEEAVAGSRGAGREVLEGLRERLAELRSEAQRDARRETLLPAAQLDPELFVAIERQVAQLKQRLRIRDSDGGRASSLDDCLAALGDIEREAGKLRDENSLLMQQLVEKKVELAEVQEEFVKTRRTLVRSMERQAHLSKKIDDIRDDPEERALATTDAKRKLTMLRTGRLWNAAVNGTR